MYYKKMLKDVEMAVQTCYTKTTQVTPSLHLFFIPDMILQAVHAITNLGY